MPSARLVARSATSVWDGVEMEDWFFRSRSWHVASFIASGHVVASCGEREDGLGSSAGMTRAAADRTADPPLEQSWQDLPPI